MMVFWTVQTGHDTKTVNLYFHTVSFTNSLQHMYIMEKCRLPKCILDYKPAGWKGMGRLRKMWKDSCAGIGLTVCAIKLMMIILLHLFNLLLLFPFLISSFVLHSNLLTLPPLYPLRILKKHQSSISQSLRRVSAGSNERGSSKESGRPRTVFLP